MVKFETNVIEIFDDTDSKKYPYSDLSYKIIGCAMKVLNYYGPWYVEYVYQKGMEHLLKKSGIPFIAQEEIPIYYEGEATGATLKPDLLVDDKIIVELKTLKELEPKNTRQLISYMHAAQKEVGLLINFGNARIEVKRYVMTWKQTD